VKAEASAHGLSQRVAVLGAKRSDWLIYVATLTRLTLLGFCSLHRSHPLLQRLGLDLDAAALSLQ
jgi:hypothetical protein